MAGEIKCVVGVDTGLTGGIAVLGIDGSLKMVCDMPIIAGKTRVFDAPGILGVLREYPASDTFVAIERTFPRAAAIGGSAAANWSLGGGLMLIVGLCVASGYRRELLDPKTWQKSMLQGIPGDTKVRSIASAQALWPGVEVVVKATGRMRVDSIRHGRSDALLIAEYMRRRLIGRDV